MPYLIEFVLKVCSCAASIKPPISFFKYPFRSHLQDSSSATSVVCYTNSPCRAFSLQLLFYPPGGFFSSTTTFSFIVAKSIHSVISQRYFFPYLTHSSIPINPLAPSILGRYTLAKFYLVCRQPFIAWKFLVLLSMLAFSSVMQSTIPALQRATPTAHVLIPPIRITPFRLWRVSAGSLKVENMIKVRENGREGGQGQVHAKAVLALFRSNFPRRGVHWVA